MAFGDYLSSMTPAGAINLGGAIYNLIEGNKAQNEADAEHSQAMADLRNQLAFEAQTRYRIADKAQALDALMTEVMQKLGPRSAVTADDIARREAQLSQQYLYDVDQAGAIAASQGFANARARGMDNSTLMNDQNIRLSEGLANARSKARMQAYGDAITQLTGADNLINNNRNNIFNEYLTAAVKPIEAYKAVLNDSPMNTLGLNYLNAQRNTQSAGENQSSNMRTLAEALGQAFKTPAQEERAVQVGETSPASSKLPKFY